MFDNLPSKYWDDKTKIEYLERRIIVYSIMYYEYNDNCISDSEYDSISQQLVEMIKHSPTEFKKTRYYYCFKKFDGSTGFDIPSKLTKSDKDYLSGIAKQVLLQYKQTILKE